MKARRDMREAKKTPIAYICHTNLKWEPELAHEYYEILCLIAEGIKKKSCARENQLTDQ
jgi:hypothetical protein